MSESFIEKIIPFIASMRKGVNNGGDEPTPSYPEGTEFDKGGVYEYAYYNKDLPISYINNILANNIDYDQEDEPDLVYFTYLLVGEGKMGENDEDIISAGKLRKSVFTENPEDTDWLYLIMCGDDEGASMDGWIYCSDDINVFGQYEVTKGWHTQTEGRIFIDPQDYKAIYEVNQWDAIKTILSSTPFEE